MPLGIIRQCRIRPHAAIVLSSSPLTFSIAQGLAFGFIAYAGIKLLANRVAQLNVAIAALAVLFALKFALL